MGMCGRRLDQQFVIFPNLIGSMRLGGSVTVPDTLRAMHNRDWNRKGRFRGLVEGSFLNGPRIMILQQVWNRWPERRNIRKMQFIAVRNHLL
jgi:hypothetical protein